jgi:short-subunit dehydrogenase
LRKEGEFIEKYVTADSHDIFSTKLLRRTFETNFFGLMDVTNAALPYLRKSEVGRMVVVGSQSAWSAGLPVSATFDC